MFKSFELTVVLNGFIRPTIPGENTSSCPPKYLQKSDHPKKNYILDQNNQYRPFVSPFPIENQSYRLLSHWRTNSNHAYPSVGLVFLPIVSKPVLLPSPMKQYQDFAPCARETKATTDVSTIFKIDSELTASKYT